MTGQLRGKTLAEKVYGDGFRPVHHSRVDAPIAGCAVETTAGHPCPDPVYGSIEMYVDDAPPLMDWYSRLMKRLPPNVWATVRFCQAHMADVIQRSVYDFPDTPDLWAPWRASPPVLTHPPKLIVAKG